MARPRGKGGNGSTGASTERWMVSYMDMVTVVMCLFIVLFAISNVDSQKYQQLKHSLQEGFGNTPDALIVEAFVEDPAEEDEAVADEFNTLEMAVAEVRDLTELRDKMAADLEARGLSDKVRFEIDERGLTVRLVSADTFFSSGSADLTGEALEILDVVGPVLAPTDYEISVEGHADYKATVGTPFPTNWELSSARATAVLRHLVEEHDVVDHRSAAVGFGSARPIAKGKDAKSLAANRRVDIMALSSQPEAVRAMIPDVLAGNIPTEQQAEALAATTN